MGEGNGKQSIENIRPMDGREACQAVQGEAPQVDETHNPTLPHPTPGIRATCSLLEPWVLVRMLG